MAADGDQKTDSATMEHVVLMCLKEQHEQSGLANVKKRIEQISLVHDVDFGPQLSESVQNELGLNYAICVTCKGSGADAFASYWGAFENIRTNDLEPISARTVEVTWMADVFTNPEFSLAANPDKSYTNHLLLSKSEEADFSFLQERLGVASISTGNIITNASTPNHGFQFACRVKHLSDMEGSLLGMLGVFDDILQFIF